MTPATLLTQARGDGVTLAVTAPDRLKLRGDPAAVAKWVPILRPIKAALVAILTQPEPPPLTPGDLADIEEAVEERAAIREFEGGEPRAVAEREARAAMRAFQVLVDMGQGQPARWVTMIAPGCNLAQAQEAALWRFPGRVLEVRGREVGP